MLKLGGKRKQTEERFVDPAMSSQIREAWRF